MTAKKRISPFTLETVLTAHLRHINASCSSKTVVSYGVVHNLLKNFLGAEMLFADIATHHIEDFLICLKEEKIPEFPNVGNKTRSRKPQTLNNYRAILSALWNWATKREYCAQMRQSQTVLEGSFSVLQSGEQPHERDIF